jgi:PqqD family protein of HPr-rel-A system
MDILQQNLGPSEDAVEARVGDETVLLQRQRGTYYSLDPMGTRVWTLLKDGRSALEICALLAEEFGVEKAEVEDDVRKFLADLQANDIVIGR